MKITERTKNYIVGYLMLSDDSRNAQGVEHWRISALRIMLITGYIFYSIIAIHSFFSAINASVYFVMPMTFAFYALAVAQLKLSKTHYHLSAYLQLFSIVAAAICINLMVDLPILAMLGPVFIFSLPLAAFILLGAKVGFVCMFINIIPFVALLNGFQLSQFKQEHILLEHADTYIITMIFLFFNICAPLGVARASLAARRLNKKITAQNANLKTQHDLYKTLFLDADIAMIIVSTTGAIIEMNDAAEGLLQYQFNQFKPLPQEINISSLFPEYSADTDNAIVNRTVDSKMKAFKISRSAQLDQQCYFLTLQDITAKTMLHKALAAQTKLNRQQLINGSNGLPNRIWLENKLKDRLKTTDTEISVYVFKINNAQFIEQKYGYNYLPLLARKMAEHWQSKNQCDCEIGSLDETNLAIAVDIPMVDTDFHITKFINLLPKIVLIDEHKIPLDIKVGVSFSDDCDQNVEKLINNAQYAVLSGNSIINYYENASLERFIEHQEINLLLHEAIINDDLNIVYQPKVKGDGRLIGLEALLRWNCPVIGVVSPSIFIPIAEKSGLVPLITQWLITQVCKQIDTWHQAGLKLVPVAINISGPDLDQESFHEYLVNSLVEYKIEPQLIELELTESATSLDLSKAQATLRYLSNWGFCVTLDDFGIGYSGLSKLISFPVKKIKIDRQFVKNIHKEEQKAKVVEAIVAMCKVFGIEFLAEGVETFEEVDKLLLLGCSNFQGYVFAKPADIEHTTSLLQVQNVFAQATVTKIPVQRS